MRTDGRWKWLSAGERTVELDVGRRMDCRWKWLSASGWTDGCTDESMQSQCVFLCTCALACSTKANVFVCLFLLENVDFSSIYLDNDPVTLKNLYRLKKSQLWYCFHWLLKGTTDKRPLTPVPLSWFKANIVSARTPRGKWNFHSAKRAEHLFIRFSVLKDVSMTRRKDWNNASVG